MKKKQVKCYTYIRVSTLTQADNFSLDAQREKLHKYAEYERENIRVQTMAGREQRAREGKWNGGFEPYGYKLINKPVFVNAIKEKIGTAVDTEDMGKELETLRGQLRQIIGTKNRLEKQMDKLDVEDKHYDKKVLDLLRRYDEQYDRIEEI